MKRKSEEAARLPGKVVVSKTEEAYRFGEIFSLTRAVFRFECFNGRMSGPVERINFERGEAVGILLVNVLADTVLLVRQFRYPVYASLSREKGFDAKNAWLLEIVAGIQDSDLDLVEIARKELLEEAGFNLTTQLKELIKIYPSPGGSSERITIFRADIEPGNRLSEGGGVIAEGEDVQVVEISLADALGMIETGGISDAKTIIALQCLALSKYKRSPSAIVEA